jgi:hypothetical protein
MWDQSCSTIRKTKNSVDGPRNVFVRFSPFLQHIAFVSLHSTKRLIFLLERRCVLCELRSHSWDIMYIIEGFVIFVMARMTPKQILIRVLQFSSVTIIPPTRHINLCLINNLIRKTSRRCLEDSTLSKIWRRTQNDLHIPLYKALTDRCLSRILFHLLNRLQSYKFILLFLLFILNCTKFDTRWQQYSTHLYTNSTQGTENGTYITIKIRRKKGDVRAVPHLCELCPGICLTTEDKTRKKPQLG